MSARDGPGAPARDRDEFLGQLEARGASTYTVRSYRLALAYLPVFDTYQGGAVLAAHSTPATSLPVRLASQAATVTPPKTWACGRPASAIQRRRVSAARTVRRVTLASAVAVAAGMLAVSWLVLFLLARRLPPGLVKDLASFLPACAITARRLRRDPRIPRRAKLLVAFAGLWVLSPIGIIPEFVPVIGPLDDVVVVNTASTAPAARRVPRVVLEEGLAW